MVGPEAKGLVGYDDRAAEEQLWRTNLPGEERAVSGSGQAVRVYIWVDGVHFNICPEEDRQCIPVLMGATADGRKELIAVTDGYRES